MSRVWAPVAWFAAGGVAALAAERLWRDGRGGLGAREIARALRHGEFQLRYQPVVDLATVRWMGVECLLRRRTARNVLVGPDAFMPAAIEAGMLEPLTARVFELIGRDILPLLRQRPDLHAAVNVPPEVMGSAYLAEVARACGFADYIEQLVIEIVQTGILDERGRRAIATARALNARIAIDDFGLGANSLAQLQDLEVDFIKIDKGFVGRIGSESPAAKLVDAIVAIARQLGVATIAEGVETTAQADYLRVLGVEYAQGFLFSRPIGARELVACLLRNGEISLTT